MIATTTQDRFMLWVDAVGAFWMCLGDEVLLGQPTERGYGPDVPILADLSARHARIRRDGEGYVLEPIRSVRLGDRPAVRPTMLLDGDRIELGINVRLRFWHPHPLSATVRLDFESRHRTFPAADAVILMAEMCLLGPSAGSHVVCPAWRQNVLISRGKDGLWCRSDGELRVDGRPRQGPVRLAECHRIAGPGFSFAWEAIRPRGEL